MKINGYELNVSEDFLMIFSRTKPARLNWLTKTFPDTEI